MERVIEKDFIDENTGKHCYVVFNRMGNRCGYVEVNEESVRLFRQPSYKQMFPTEFYSENIEFANCALSIRRMHKRCVAEDFCVHGGVTFNGNMDFNDKEYKYVLGFDCGHFCDRVDVEAYKKHFGDNTELLKVILKTRSTENVMTVDDVAEECIRLAEQIHKYEVECMKFARIKTSHVWKKRKEQLEKIVCMLKIRKDLKRA